MIMIMSTVKHIYCHVFTMCSVKRVRESECVALIGCYFLYYNLRKNSLNETDVVL